MMQAQQNHLQDLSPHQAKEEVEVVTGAKIKFHNLFLSLIMMQHYSLRPLVKVSWVQLMT